MNPVLQTIRSRGHWVVTIRPTTFNPAREPKPLVLGEFVQKNKVRMGGWSFPQCDPNKDPVIGPDFAEQEGQCGHHIEMWRLYQSGQFVSNKACFEDWSEHWPRFDRQPRPARGEELHVYPSLLLLISVCEFAARLAMSSVGSERLVIDVMLRGMRGRRLLIRNLMRGELETPRVANIEEYRMTRTLGREELLASPSELGISITRDLFRRFSWDAQLSTLREIHRDMSQ